MRAVILLLVLMLIVAGCTSQNNTATQPPPSQPPFTVEPEVPIKIDTLNYSNLYTSFSYPNTMNWEERLNNYQNGKGHAYVKFADERSAILLGYLYVGNVSELKAADPYQVAAVNLESESTAEKDPLGILHSATDLGPVSSGQVDKGYVAVRKFTVVEQNPADNLYGIAVDIYVPDSMVLYDLRIFSTNEKMVKPIGDVVLNSLKFHPTTFTGDVNATQNISMQNISQNLTSNLTSNLTVNVSSNITAANTSS